ncbi:hypothetical protein AB0G74_07855 [Streptomyces sp. NPDC020875]|uniref:hypothetical protein n=1 Tax=Streptomyces sp. NPDC020875 TaxID=3154898 RepID=UPI0033CB672E
MDETARVPSGGRTTGRARSADPLVAGLVVLVNLLLCGWLALMIIGTGLSTGTPEDAREAEAGQTLAGQVYFGWLVGGLLLLALLRLPRSALCHLASLLLPPALLAIWFLANA